mmetsp:Transcript_92579/g.239738  ORF Transcript_92579/g.239738 Transcript_92579/m.239738 type:complete len:90 (+) Transcript_92579:120-389(+)
MRLCPTQTAHTASSFRRVREHDHLCARELSQLTAQMRNHEGSLCELANATCADSNLPQVTRCPVLKQDPREHLKSTCIKTGSQRICKHH